MNDLSLFQSFVLGALQGLAEFLPISSSAHLALAPWAFGWPEPGLAFDVALHLGTLVAVLWYFRRDWLALAVAAYSVIRERRVYTDEQRLVTWLIIATVPGAIAGLLFEKQAEHLFRAPSVIAVALIVMGALLWIVDVRAARAARERSLGAMTWRDALLIGCAQAFAIIPGVSRSGATMTAGRALSFTRADSAKFSFMMSMPIIAAAAVLKLPKLISAGGLTPSLIVGVATAAITGWLAIAILMRLVQHGGFRVFALYRFALGAAVLILVALRAR